MLYDVEREAWPASSLLEWLPLLADLIAETTSLRGDSERRLLHAALRYLESTYLSLRAAFAAARLAGHDVSRPAVQCRVLTLIVPALVSVLSREHDNAPVHGTAGEPPAHAVQVGAGKATVAGYRRRIWCHRVCSDATSVEGGAGWTEAVKQNKWTIAVAKIAPSIGAVTSEMAPGLGAGIPLVGQTASLVNTGGSEASSVLDTSLAVASAGAGTVGGTVGYMTAAALGAARFSKTYAKAVIHHKELVKLERENWIAQR